MAMQLVRCFLAALAGAALLGTQARADYFFFTTGNPDHRMAVGARVETDVQVEVEPADDFILERETLIWHANFTGLLPSDAPLSDVAFVLIEIYRVFPKDSDADRMIHVPTRMNSPSD